MVVLKLYAMSRNSWRNWVSIRTIRRHRKRRIFAEILSSFIGAEKLEARKFWFGGKKCRRKKSFIKFWRKDYPFRKTSLCRSQRKEFQILGSNLGANPKVTSLGEAPGVDLLYWPCFPILMRTSLVEQAICLMFINVLSLACRQTQFIKIVSKRVNEKLDAFFYLSRIFFFGGFQFIWNRN